MLKYISTRHFGKIYLIRNCLKFCSLFIRKLCLFKNMTIKTVIISFQLIKLSLYIKQVPTCQIICINIIIHRFMPFIRSCHFANLIPVFFFYILTTTCPKSCSFYKYINSFIIEKFQITCNTRIIINTVCHRRTHMVFIICHIASVTTSIRLYSISRTLLGSVIRRFPWILCTFVSVFLRIFLSCIK